MLKSSLFNQFHFFKIEIKDTGVLMFSFFIMNVWEGRDGERVSIKMHGCIFTRREVKKFDILRTL